MTFLVVFLNNFVANSAFCASSVAGYGMNHYFGAWNNLLAVGTLHVFGFFPLFAPIHLSKRVVRGLVVDGPLLLNLLGVNFLNRLSLSNASTLSLGSYTVRIE